VEWLKVDSQFKLQCHEKNKKGSPGPGGGLVKGWLHPHMGLTATQARPAIPATVVPGQGGRAP
jgi:hypothetical protein